MAKEKVDEAVKMEENAEPPKPEDVFKFTYKELTKRQIKQMKDL